jgi:pimeloyl-ACP methyl ester carboxylesterase
MVHPWSDAVPAWHGQVPVTRLDGWWQMFRAANRLGFRWVSYDRPGHGGSTPFPRRDVASAAAHTSRAADALGVEQFAAVGHSGGAPHALACAALLPRQVPGAGSPIPDRESAGPVPGGVGALPCR